MKKLRIFHEESGQALVGFALLLSLLLGFSALVVDVGAMYVQKRELQNAADSAALAGAAELQQNGTGTAVTAQVEAYLKENLQTSPYEAEIEITTTQVEVQITQKTTNYFASFLNADPSNVTATAAAEAVKSISIEGLRPWALEEGKSNPEFPIKIKDGGGGGENGYFDIVDFDGGSSNSNEYQDRVENGYSGSVSIGQTVERASGNKNSVKSIVDTFIYKSSLGNNEWQKATLNDSRVVKVPVVRYSETLDKKGKVVNSSTTIVGFAVIFLISYSNKGEIVAQVLYDTTWTDAQKQGLDSFGLEGDVRLVK